MRRPPPCLAKIILANLLSTFNQELVLISEQDSLSRDKNSSYSFQSVNVKAPPTALSKGFYSEEQAESVIVPTIIMVDKERKNFLVIKNIPFVILKGDQVLQYFAKE